MDNKGQFKKGHRPWNKDKKGIHLSKETEFKKGQFEGDKNHNWRGGIQVNKNDCIYLYDGANKRARRPAKVLEAAGVQVPKNWIVYHIDGIKTNDEITNLIAIPRAILIKLNNGSINANYYNIDQAIKVYLKEK